VQCEVTYQAVVNNVLLPVFQHVVNYIHSTTSYTDTVNVSFGTTFTVRATTNCANLEPSASSSRSS
jgi:hypothetical protein